MSALSNWQPLPGIRYAAYNFCLLVRKGQKNGGQLRRGSSEGLDGAKSVPGCHKMAAVTVCVARPDMRCPRTRFVTPAMLRNGGEGDLAQRSSALVFFSLLISRVPATRRHNNWRRATIRDDVVAAAARVFCLGCRLRAAASSERPVAASCPALQSNAAADVLRTVPLRSQSPQTTGTEK